MPRAILALRNYPIALLAALLLFVCTLLLATASGGVIRGGGDDQGSGMGGTGKSGGFGDSGFGGTGGPSPFLGDAGDAGDTDADADYGDRNHRADPQSDWPAPWLPREFPPQAQETARIPDDMQPLIELQRNPPVDPFRTAPFRTDPVRTDPADQPGTSPADNADTLRIIDPDNSALPPHARHLMQLADSGEQMIEEAPSEIRLTVPEIPAAEDVGIEQYTMDDLAEYSGNNTGTVEIAESLTEVESETVNALIDESADRRISPERFQRPELPPIQRMRPAVDRASIMPPRVQPMRI